MESERPPATLKFPPPRLALPAPASSGLSSVTPGCKSAKVRTLRPFNGRLTMGRAVTDWPSVGFTVSTLVPAPLTSTVSDRAPTDKCRSIRSCWLI